MRSFENKNPEREPRWEVGRFMHVCICSHFFLSIKFPGAFCQVFYGPSFHDSGARPLHAGSLEERSR